MRVQAYSRNTADYSTYSKDSQYISTAVQQYIKASHLSCAHYPLGMLRTACSARLSCALFSPNCMRMNSFEVFTVLLMLLVLDAYARGGGSPILRLPRALGGCQALPLTVHHEHRTRGD